MISREKMDFAVSQVVDNCLKVKKGEKTCMITDVETKHIGMAIAERLKEVSGNVEVFIMEDFGPRPEDGSSPLKFPEKIAQYMRSVSVSVYAAQGKKGEYPTFRKPMVAEIITNKLRHGHMIGISDKLMETGMSADYGEVQKISKMVYDIVSSARQIHVTTSKGTDLIADINPSWKWLVDDGNIKPGTLANLPAGEVFSCPKDINGHAVIDGVLGEHLIKVGVIEKNPIHLDIKDGRIISVKCADKYLEKEIVEYIHQKQENANRIGELGIGTNIALKNLVGNLLQDEKFPGVHIAAGHSFSEHTGADWSSNVHLDMVIQKVNIDADGRQIMKEGKFTL